MMPARDASALSIFQQDRTWRGGLNIISTRQARDKSLAAQNQARTAALVTSGHSTAGDAVPQQTTVNTPLHGQIVRQAHADQSLTIQRHGDRESRATAATSSSPTIIPNTRHTMSSHRLSTLDAVQTRAVETLDPAEDSRSNQITDPSQGHVQQGPSPSSTLGRAVHVTRSTQFYQPVQGTPNQPGPPQASVAQYPSPLRRESYRGPQIGAEHFLAGLAPPRSFSGTSAPATTPSLNNSHLLSHSPQLKFRDCPRDVPEHASGKLGFDDTTSTLSTGVPSKQYLDLILNPFDGTETEAASASALVGSDHEPATMQTSHKISNSLAKILTDPNLPTTISNENHGHHDQRQNVGSQPLLTNTPAVSHSITATGQGLGRMLIPREETNTGADSAVATNRYDLAATQPWQAGSTIRANVSSNSFPSSTITHQDHSVRGQQQNYQQQENSQEQRDVDPRLGSATSTPSEIRAHEPEPTAEPEIGARYNPHNEFTTAVLPLSANVPCMICKGTKEHDSSCMVAGE
jgi:hypothetical protein